VDPGAGPLIWIVDADQWPRASLRAELLERGYDAVGFVHLEEALARLVRPGAEPPAVLLIDLEEQTVTARQLELLARRQVRVALTGGKLALADPALTAPAAGTFRAAIVLPRPIRIGELADAVGSLLPPRPPR
jgi:hypothetical protein